MIIEQEIIDTYGKYLQARRLSDQSQRVYMSDIYAAIDMLGPVWNEETDFLRFVEATGSANTQHRRRTSLRKFVRWAQQQGYTAPVAAVNALPGVALEQGERLTAEQLGQAWEAIATLPYDVQAALYLCTEAAIPAHEVIALDVGDVDPHQLTLNLPGRIYPLTEAWTPRARKALAAWYGIRTQNPLTFTRMSPLFLTRQSSRRANLNARWLDVVQPFGLTAPLSSAQQTRAEHLKRQYPDIAETLLGYTGAVILSPAVLAERLSHSS